MKMNPLERNPVKGSALLAAMIVITILSFAAAGVLSYSLTTYRNSVRQATLDQAKVIADSEMENLYYEWKTDLVNKMRVANVVSALAPLTGSQVPFASNLQVAGGWSVTRFIEYNGIYGPGHTGDGGASGIVPGTNELGRNYYFTAETSASINKPLLGTVTYKSGHHFTFSSTSLFQFAVFYQGNLEMAAGGNMTIGGPVSTNASAFLGAQDNNNNPYTLNLTDSVYFFQNYNGAADPLTGETRLLEGSSTLVDPTYNPNPQASAPADQAAQRALQVSKMAQQASFVGGVDVAADIANPTYQAAYTNLQGNVDPNEIYRAVVAPPPTDANGNLLPEDPVVAASRMYNTAGILITIDQTAPGSSNIQINVGTAANPTQYNNEPAFSSIVNPTGTANSIIQNPRTPIVDPRELLNGTTGVNVTTFDIGNLNNALATAMVSNAALAANYNGVVYIYDNSNNATAGAPNTLNGIRLTDATTTPNYNDQNGNPLGFTVVSNNGVYVQGDYNTTGINVQGNQVTNPAAIMGDAITALSQGFSMANAATLQNIDQSNGNGNPLTRQATISASTPQNGVNPPSSGTPNGMTIDAAILTGNTPSTLSNNSGGAQNLVRMIEDWFYPDPLNNGTGMALTLNGSLGQLFISKYFNSQYAPGMQAGLGTISPGVYNRVYIQPKIRNVNYDLNFKQRTPAGSPTTTSFTRGDFFFW